VVKSLITEARFRGSSMVEQFAVNEKVLGSSPSRGALLLFFRTQDVCVLELYIVSGTVLKPIFLNL
jgi:hypothetical protein